MKSLLEPRKEYSSRVFSIFKKNGNGLMNSMKSLLACFASVQANILVADAGFNLVYANKSALNTLKKIEGEISDEFDVSLEDLVGSSIHRFHKDPQRIEKILRNPSALPHTAEFSFGGVTLAATINSFVDSCGMILGYVVNWEDVSKTNATKRSMDRVNSMMENAPVNVIFAEKDSFKITYGHL